MNYHDNNTHGIGLQVDIKRHFKDASVQCCLLTSVTTSTPIKRDKVHFPASESDLSEVNDPRAADVSSSVYCCDTHTSTLCM